MQIIERGRKVNRPSGGQRQEGFRDCKGHRAFETEHVLNDRIDPDSQRMRPVGKRQRSTSW